MSVTNDDRYKISHSGMFVVSRTFVTLREDGPEAISTEGSEKYQMSVEGESLLLDGEGNIFKWSRLGDKFMKMLDNGKWSKWRRR